MLRLCKLSSDQLSAALGSARQMMENGLRVLAIARALWPASSALPTAQTEFSFSYIGLVGFRNPVRPVCCYVVFFANFFL